MNDARQKRNEQVIGHLERLGRVRADMLVVQGGIAAPSGYEVNEIVEAMKRLAKEVVAEDLVEAVG